ncbi:hypothetical protein Taro_000456 [Colocasia esculenta]|uniref:Uncharacterized protein n=1 Tax=Colocasia esculenta TaxID=4460 RepID=A0A843T773_COLES|nr:hypothetical protein [Colocasia esculenta]
MKVRVRGNEIAITQNTTTRQQDFYPSSELISTGDLCPVPEQYLRISLIKGTVPLKDTTTPSSAGLPSHPKGTTPWIPPGLPSHQKGTTPWIPPSLPSHQKGTTPWIPPGLPSHQKGTTQREKSLRLPSRYEFQRNRYEN